MRLDKWLWAARFFKTRSLAAEEIGKGRVRVNGAEIKPAKEIRPGDTIALRSPLGIRTFEVKGLSAQRGPAPVAQQLYEESPESLANRLAAAEQRRLAPEPAMSLRQGRPTKHDRRALERETGSQRAKPDWDARWTAQIVR